MVCSARPIFKLGYYRFAQLGGVTFILGATARDGRWTGIQAYFHRPVVEDCGVAARGNLTQRGVDT